MKIYAFIATGILVSSGILSNAVAAAPIQFDTDDAHVIVTRPIDIWSASSANSDDVNSRFQLKQMRVAIEGEKGKWISAGDLFDGSSMVKECYDIAKKNGFATSGYRGLIFRIGKPVSIPVEVMPDFQKSQDENFKELVLKNGSPADLRSKVSSRRWISTVAAMVVGKVALNAVGNGLAGPVLNGPAQDVYALSMHLGGMLNGQPSVPFDYSTYKTVDIRKVVATDSPDRFGLIIIAYRGDKSDAAEQHALAQAIATATGTDTNINEIEKSQAEDLALRQKIWDDNAAENTHDAKQ